MLSEKWNLSNIPPTGHSEVGEFAQNLFDVARNERERLDVPQRLLDNYAMFRGGKRETGRKSLAKALLSVNLLFANVMRTVSNITARIPTGEVVDMDGVQDEAENILSVQLKKWWKDTNQQGLTKDTAQAMEVYGLTVEKPTWDKKSGQPAIAIVDPFAFFPAPGNWAPQEIATKCPYICYAYTEFISEMESFYNVKGIAPDEAYGLMGTEREEYKPAKEHTGSYARYSLSSKAGVGEKKLQRALIVEVWLRDNRTKTEKISEPVLDENGQQAINETGELLFAETTQTVPVYRDGIRKITITKTKDTKSGIVVLDDCGNPNINPEIETELAINTYPWGRIPCYFANSYKDGVSLWGFAAAEQVGDLIAKFNYIISKLVAYVTNVMVPPLIIQQGCDISRSQLEASLEKSGRLVIMPSIPNARIEFMQIPNLPATFFNVLDILVGYFDRVYQIEEADRGVKPKGVIAASAIMALQERNQVLMQAKTSSIDNLVENRSKWAIGLWQNHGTKEESVNVEDEAMPFVGVDFVGRKFNYVVESGSTTPRTSLYKQELLQKLWETQAVDRRALLEGLNIDGWKAIVERMGETELDAALSVLIAAGLPEEQAVQLKQNLLQPQGGPGDTKQTSSGKKGMPHAGL